MELLRVVNELKEGFKLSGLVEDENIIILKDINKDIDKFREHIDDYVGFISILNGSFDFEDGDEINVAIGVAGRSTRNDDDYLQVVSKCSYILKTALKNAGYNNDDDADSISFTIDSEEREDSILIYTYGDILFEIKLANGADNV